MAGGERRGRNDMTIDIHHPVKIVKYDDEYDSKPAKPLIGVMPRNMWDLQRLRDLGEAIKRYCAAGMIIPSEWIDEYNDICRRLEE